MKVKNIVDEDFTNYKKPSMFIGLGTCNWKCCNEANIDKSICQNSALALLPDIEISIEDIIGRYVSNSISKSIVIGGLEPFSQFRDICNLVNYFRKYVGDDDIVIYTGHTKEEITGLIKTLTEYAYKTNIIIKFGRFVPNQNKHFDETLGVYLVSDNQYGEVIC